MEQQQYEEQIGRDGLAEREQAELPRIYVASLSDYANGHLHGRWIDATQDIDDITAEVNDMLAASPDGAAEEYAIHDFEGFGPYRVGEYESLDSVVRIAQGIEEHGQAFAHWIDVTGVDESDYHTFSDYYLGHWESMIAYTEELIDDLGVYQLLEELQLTFHQYLSIDVQALARDLRHDYITSEDDTGIHIWSAR